MIEILACGESPLVGKALEFLTDVVCQHPGENNPEALRTRLEGWNPR